MRTISFILLLSVLFVKVDTFSQSTVSTNIIYSGFQACGGCAVCGADYWCIGIHGSWCGDIPNCDNRTFIDPVPPGNLVTNITLKYWSGNCNGAAINASVEGNPLPVAYDGNTGCWCSDDPCGMTSMTSENYPCGLINYNYGGINNLQICVGTGELDPSVCFSRIEVVLTYLSQDTTIAAITPSGPTVFCPGDSVILNAGIGCASYFWNTGDTTQNITVSTTGTYSVTVICSNGSTASDSVDVFSGQYSQAGFTYSVNDTVVDFINTSTSGNYLWDFGDGDTSTQINPTHVFSIEGTYEVCLTVYTACDTSVLCQYVIITGSGHSEYTGGVSIYPNPAQDIINIDFATIPPKLLKITIYDISGRAVVTQVLDKRKNSIDIKKLSKGIYTIKADDVFLLNHMFVR